MIVLRIIGLALLVVVFIVLAAAALAVGVLLGLEVATGARPSDRQNTGRTMRFTTI